MTIRRRLLRGAAALALASAIVGIAALTPNAQASPLHDAAAAEAVHATMNKRNDAPIEYTEHRSA